MKLANELQDSMNLILQNIKRKIAHFTKNDLGTIEVFAQDSPNLNSLICAICKREPVLFVQSCDECIFNLTTFCISHCTDANFICNVRPHRGTIYRRVPQMVLEKKLAVLWEYLKLPATKLHIHNAARKEQGAETPDIREI